MAFIDVWTAVPPSHMIVLFCDNDFCIPQHLALCPLTFDAILISSDRNCTYFNGPSYTHTFCFCCKRFCIGFNFAAFLLFFWPTYFLGSDIQPSVFKMPFEQCWSCPGSQQLLIGSVSRSVLLIKQLSVSTSHYPTLLFFGNPINIQQSADCLSEGWSTSFQQ